MSNAQKNQNDLTASVEEIKKQIAQAEQDVTSAQTTYNEAKQLADDAAVLIAKGSYGFFEYNGSADAVQALNKSIIQNMGVDV